MNTDARPVDFFETIETPPMPTLLDSSDTDPIADAMLAEFEAEASAAGLDDFADDYDPTTDPDAYPLDILSDA